MDAEPTPTAEAPPPPRARPPGVLWWRSLFRGLGVSALALGAAAVLQLGLVALEGHQYRLGHLYRALRLTPAHLPLLLPLSLAASALVACRGRPTTRRRTAFVLALCGLLLAALEVNQRIEHARDYELGFPRLGWWTGETDGRQPFRVWGGEGDSYAFWLTPQGLRSRVPTPPRHPGRRALCLGDSFTWANAVPDQANWTVPAAARLGFPLLNASMHGYGVDQMATLYSERLVDRLDHTEVVVSVILDDAYRAASRWFLGRPKPFTPVGGELEPCPPPLRWGRIPLAPESRVLAPWRQTAGHLLQALGLRADHRDHFQDALRRIVRAAGGRPVYLQVFSTPFDQGRQSQTLLELGAAAGVTDGVAIDLSGLYVPGDGHPTVEGHARIAEHTARLLTR